MEKLKNETKQRRGSQAKSAIGKGKKRKKKRKKKLIVMFDFRKFVVGSVIAQIWKRNRYKEKYN